MCFYSCLSIFYDFVYDDVRQMFGDFEAILEYSEGQGQGSGFSEGQGQGLQFFCFQGSYKAIKAYIYICFRGNVKELLGLLLII